MSKSKEVNESSSCCSVPITSLTGPHTPPPACAHSVSRNATPTHSCPEPSSPLPHDRHRPTRTSLGSQPSDMERPWRGALLFPSRGWRGACFPPLPFRTQTGMYLGQPGRGWTCQGSAGGMGVAMTASFRFLAFLSLAPSSLSPSSRPARADAPLVPALGVGGGEPILSIWTVTPPHPANDAAPTPTLNVHTHSPFPKARSPGGRRVPPPQEKSNGTVHGRHEFLVFLPFR